MKSASFIAEMPIVSIDEGEEIAIVKNILVNQKLKKVDYLSVEHSNSNLAPSLLSFTDVISIGKDYVVIQSNDTIKKAYNSKENIFAAEECVLLENRKVVSSAGDNIGNVADYEINEKSGEIEKLMLDSGNDIAKEEMISFSPKFIFVSDGEYVSVEHEPSLLDEGSFAYLLGKTVNEDITSADGQFHVAQGTVLTEELINEAEKHDALLQLTLAV